MKSSINDTITFNCFWKAMNDLMKDKGLAELDFGTARTYWHVALEQARLDRDGSFRRKMKELGATVRIQ